METAIQSLPPLPAPKQPTDEYILRLAADSAICPNKGDPALLKPHERDYLFLSPADVLEFARALLAVGSVRAVGQMTDEQEREAFEAWFTQDGTYEPEQLFRGRGLYDNADTENMHQAWQARAALAGAGKGEPTPQKLWLWKNGPHEYWAFNNAYPIHLDSDDPQTLGEPCGYALMKPSRNSRPNVDEAEVMKRVRSTWKGSHE